MKRLSLNAPYACRLWAVVLSAFTAWNVLGGGVPLLRHDWRIPRAADAVGPWIASFYQPWLPGGIGAPQPYPTFYWIGFALWPLHGFLSAWTVLLLSVCVAVAMAALAAARTARNMGGGTVAALAMATLAVLNPWVYSKYAAGHIFMVLAYAILLALIAEASRPVPRQSVLIVLAAVSITQLQFFVIAVVPLAVWAAKTRRWPLLAAMLVSALPVAVGVAAYYGALRETPYTLTWQRGSSVPLGNGLLLGGYEFHYAAAFGALWPAIAVLGAIAIAGVLLSGKRPIVWLATLCAAWAVLTASGASGFLAQPYAWIVVHVPESGLFRELYDLIAVVVIGYVVAASAALGALRSRTLLPFLALAASAALAIAWIARPVSSFFVAGTHIPIASLPLQRQQRVALFPAYQPQSLTNGEGSGFDPDLFVQSARSLPVNEFLPDFPVDMALSYAWYRSDFRRLQALGVSSVISRPYLRTSWASLQYQQTLLQRPSGLPKSFAMKAIALLSTTRGTPAISVDAQDLASNAVFFTDDSRFASDAVPLRASATAGIDAKRAWVDVRFANISHPEWLTAFGGVATASAVTLPVQSRYRSVLAQTTGVLVNQSGAVIARKTTSLHWWNLPADTTSLRCAGKCAVVLQATLPRASVPKPAQWTGISFRQWSPWLIIAQIPASSTTRTLRFSESFSPYWGAFDSRQRRLLHLRLNSALNAWLLPPGDGGRIAIVQWVALAQFVSECIAFIGVIGMALYAVLRGRKTPGGGLPAENPGTLSMP